MIRLYLLPFKRTFFPNASLSRRELADRLRRGVTYVAAPGPGQPIDGFCHAMIDKKTLWIDLLAVDSRQRKRGRGSRLLERAERYGRRNGCRMSQLYVDEHNTGAQAFYRKQGYEPKEYVPGLHCYLFVKELSNRAPLSIWRAGSLSQRDGVGSDFLDFRMLGQ
jgi:ribosomal protein S18 acetylase RimI-like enzyme